MNQESHIGLVSKIGGKVMQLIRVEKSTGQIISWLNSDDLYLNDTLKFVIDYFNKYPKCDVVVGACQRIDENGKKLDSIKRVKEFDLNSIIYNYNSLPQPSVFLKRV